MSDFDPNSTDSKITELLTLQKAQSTTLEEIKAQTMKTNGRVTKLENQKWFERGIFAAISVIAGGLWEYLNKK